MLYIFGRFLRFVMPFDFVLVIGFILDLLKFHFTIAEIILSDSSAEVLLMVKEPLILTTYNNQPPLVDVTYDSASAAPTMFTAVL